MDGEVVSDQWVEYGVVKEKAYNSVPPQVKREKVEHPDHYNWIPGIECLAVVEHFNFTLGSAIKYLWRAGRKDSETMIDDLKKARFYIDHEIKRLEQK